MLTFIKNLGITLLGCAVAPLYITSMAMTRDQFWWYQLIACLLTMSVVAFGMALLMEERTEVHELLIALNLLAFLAGVPLVSGMAGSPFFMFGGILVVPLAFWVESTLGDWQWKRQPTKKVTTI